MKGCLTAFFSKDDPDANDKFRRMFSPEQIDQMVRQAIGFCWMTLPDDRKNVDEVEKQMRRILDRALRDLRDDFDSFGLDKQ